MAIVCRHQGHIMCCIDNHNHVETNIRSYNIIIITDNLLYNITLNCESATLLLSAEEVCLTCIIITSISCYLT